MNRRELQALIDSNGGGAVVIPNGDHIIDLNEGGVILPPSTPSCLGESSDGCRISVIPPASVPMNRNIHAVQVGSPTTVIPN